MSGKIIVNVHVTAFPGKEDGELFAVPVNFTLENRLAMIQDPGTWTEEKAHLQKKAMGQAIEYLLEWNKRPCSSCHIRPAVYLSGSPMLTLDRDNGTMGWDSVETPHCAQPECIMEIRRRYKLYMKATTKQLGKHIPWTHMCGYCKRIGVIDHESLPTQGLLRCSGCRMVWYCNKDCQKLHWKQGHKEECETAAAVCHKSVNKDEWVSAL
mmetsp:Transcript_12388/g.14937  ORF Transcript_12388/g.14937 Transcript_12388/m.14937 type:complete len:210 (-) Transcript_12388:159-788(-)|eukprot:CAMPEP_0195290710 /NCGR_PEP_ID=MMETSP0707-20130614/6470_1 /TAXON_ID=33640 /ORGANISM="Asterionellopsis glacialis, Strain CCMP134" /LENGTH=209 /DNA_ID=CAMNT_0040350875 /DNA_START=71 /DNA_END=700 /DNA_ORIENTATION=-